MATLIVSVLLFIAGFELLEESIRGILRPQESTASLNVILIITGTIVIKELMARFSYQLGDMIDSQALKADALHHRTDVFATGLVVVALIASHFGFRRVDGIMGALVSLIIFYSAYVIAREAVNPLLGEAPSDDTIMEIDRLAKTFDGVLGVHDIIYHKYGQTIIISLHIEVSDKGSAFDLHALSETVEEAIGQKIGGIVIAHIDPINMDHPQYHAIEREIKKIISRDQRVDSYDIVHDLRIIVYRALNKCSAVFDIVLEKDADEQDRYDIVRSIRERVAEKFQKETRDGRRPSRSIPHLYIALKIRRHYPEREGIRSITYKQFGRFQPGGASRDTGAPANGNLPKGSWKDCRSCQKSSDWSASRRIHEYPASSHL